jgi:glycosyltransferase involved in cell wall biosynthesis
VPAIDLLIGRPDVLHVLTPVVPVPTRAPLVVTIHDLLPIHHPEWYSPRERWLFDRATRHAAGKAARVVAVSQAVAADAQETLRIAPERITVIPEAARPEFSRPPDPAAANATCRRYSVEPGRFILFIGGVLPRKNLGVLLAALAQLRARLPDLCLVVAGPIGADSQPVLNLSQELGLGSSVRFTGYLPDTEVHELLASALCLAHPSIYEGFGLTPLEAMSAGCPVICSDAGALPEVATGAGLMVPPDSPEDWREAIERVEGDAALRDSLVAGGHARAEELSWDVCARRTAAVYAECLAAHRPS